jgi:FkbM family methyltransferase
MSNSAIPLPPELLRNCRMLPDRTDVLRYLPKNITFVEVGVALGDFTARVLETCTVSHFIAIDVFTIHNYPGTWDGRVGRELGDLDHRTFYERRFAETIEAGRMTVLEGDSAAMLETLPDHSVDVCYIDADHAYEAVARDLSIVRRKMIPGGLIILNDYTMFDQFRLIPYGVVRAAHEFMIEGQWEMIFFALHPDMFCDITIRQLPGGARYLPPVPAPARSTAPTLAEPAKATDKPVIVNRPDPALGIDARTILGLLRPMDPIGVGFVRKGRDFDGGYIMADCGLENTVAYSLGISDDVSWDVQMAALGCQIFQYDHTVPASPQSHENLHFFPIGIAAQSSPDGRFCSLEELVDRNGHGSRSDMILKLDIEGAEWEVLASAGATVLRHFSQIVVELHGLVGIDDQEKRRQIFAALLQLNVTHQVVHVHANNYGWIGLLGGVVLPDTLEVTYLRKADHSFTECARCFPTELDLPCNPAAADYFLGPLGAIPALPS